MVVLARENGEGDAGAVRATLAVLTEGSERRPPVVVEMLDSRNARSLSVAAGDRVLTVEADDIIAKVTAQACYQPGSASSTGSCSTSPATRYFAPAPELAGHTFGEALLAYDRSTVIGRATAGGQIALAPPMTTSSGAGDRVIAISADDDTVVFGGFKDVQAPPPPRTPASNGASAGSMLVVGWSTLGARILAELDAVASGPRTVDVAVDDTMVPAGSLVAAADRLTVRFLAGADDPDRLVALVQEHGYDHVVALGYRDALTPAHADARTLLSLLTSTACGAGLGWWRRSSTHGTRSSPSVPAPTTSWSATSSPAS